VVGGLKHGAVFALVHALGFVLLGGAFAWARAGHFLRIRTIVEIVAGIVLATGIGRPDEALVLTAFTVAASAMLFDFWRHRGPQRQGLRSAFTINVPVTGGLIIAATSEFP